MCSESRLILKVGLQGPLKHMMSFRGIGNALSWTPQIESALAFQLLFVVLLQSALCPLQQQWHAPSRSNANGGRWLLSTWPNAAANGRSERCGWSVLNDRFLYH